MSTTIHRAFGIALLVAAAGVLGACGEGAEEAEVASTEELSTRLEEIQTKSADLEGLRQEIEEAKEAIVELEAVPENQRTPDQSEELQTLTQRVDELQGQVQQRYEGLQNDLSEFLNLALNEHPEAAETKAGLDLYSREAIVTAHETVEASGNYPKAIENLETAQGYYRAANLEPLGDLEEEITRFDDWRYVTEERFSQVEDGMTEAEVSEVLGVPYYLNQQEDPERGITYWKYAKRNGGAAVVYFDEDGEVYNTDWEAIPASRVVED